MGKTSGWIRPLASLSLLAAAGVVSANGVISAIETRKVGDGVEIVVTGEDLAKPETARAWRNEAFIFSFKAEMKAKSRKETVGHAGVQYVQNVQFTTRPMVARVVLRLRPTDTPTIRPIENGWLIQVGNVPANPENNFVSNTDTRSTATEINLGNTPEKAPTPKPQPKPVTSKPNLLPGVTRPESSAVLSSGKVQPPKPSNSGSRSNIQLNFDEADVVQVLKALAAQADVNIVTSPDVKGNISVALNNVSVEHALNVVTALAGLRYQKMDNTIIVAPADKLASIVQNARSASAQVGMITETRIVPLFSRQGRQVKAALYRVVPQDSIQGRYELALPSDALSTIDAIATPDSVLKPESGGAPAGGGAPASGGNKSSSSADEYIMIIGAPARLDEVENAVKALDKQIATALGVDTPSTNAIVQENYVVKGSSAAMLLVALGAKEGKVGEVTVVATPNTSSSRQTIVLTGRENEVQRVVNVLEQLDSGVSPDESFEVYDVKFADPRALRDSLMLQVSGLKAFVPPAGAGNTRLYEPTTFKSSSSSSGNGSGTTASESTSTETEGKEADAGPTGNTVGLPQGLAQPYKNFETVAVPMRLILRGEADALNKGKELLAMLDNEPSHVALELRVMELTKEDATNVGLDWNLFTGGAVKFIRMNNSIENPNNTVGVGINDRNFSGDVIGQLDKIANRTNLIARPNLVGYDGRETEVFIGDVIRYVESVVASQNGPSVTIKELRVGVNFAVLPRIAQDGSTVTLDMRPTVSSLKGFTRVSLSGFSAELPQTAETVTQSTVTLKDGETIAIGGLISEQIIRQSKGVPLLMDLPILGQFFRNTINTKNRRELVIFITTKQIKGPLGANDRKTLPGVEEIMTAKEKAAEKKKP